MMFWYGHDVSGWGWFAMSAGMILFWVLIITVAVLLFRTLNGPQEHTRTPSTPSAEDILRERLARGEIDEDEYRRRLDALHSGPATKS
ncbi:SHOCT domain-containing protein [Streptomyces sp. NPDC000987]|uniref:SHOCT domain-containing protein n=1 Tax=Streptomyces sp. NPDC000987 TaxID=3154374 RepID=UPI00332468FB